MQNILEPHELRAAWKLVQKQAVEMAFGNVHPALPPFGPFYQESMPLAHKMMTASEDDMS